MLNEKELYCLAKYIQECAGISLACQTCKYVKECVKDDFPQIELLLKVERQTDLLIRKPQGKINILIDYPVIMKKDIDIDIENISEKIAERLLKSLKESIEL